MKVYLAGSWGERQQLAAVAKQICGHQRILAANIVQT